MSKTDQSAGVSVEVYERAISMCEGKGGQFAILKDVLQESLIKKLKQEKEGFSIVEGIIRQNMDIKLEGKK